MQEYIPILTRRYSRELIFIGHFSLKKTLFWLRKDLIPKSFFQKKYYSWYPVKADHHTPSAQKNLLVLALQSSNSAVQDIIDKTNHADVQKSLNKMKGRIAAEKAQMDKIGQAQNKNSTTKAAFRAEI